MPGAPAGGPVPHRPHQPTPRSAAEGQGRRSRRACEGSLEAWRAPWSPQAAMEDGFTHKFCGRPKDFADFHNRFTAAVPHNESPTNPDYNGGVRYAVHSLNHGTRVDGSTLLGSSVIEGNNTSVVVMLLYQGVLFVCPGDIEPLGWQELWRLHEASYRELIDSANCRFLVAPHHGRKSGYCRDMMTSIQPHATFISDVWGASETHPSFRADPRGVRFQSGQIIKYYTTKRAGRVKVTVSPTTFTIDQYDR